MVAGAIAVFTVAYGTNVFTPLLVIYRYAFYAWAYAGCTLPVIITSAAGDPLTGPLGVVAVIFGGVAAWLAAGALRDARKLC